MTTRKLSSTAGPVSHLPTAGSRGRPAAPKRASTRAASTSARRPRRKAEIETQSETGRQKRAEREGQAPGRSRASGVRILTSAKLAKIPWLLHGFSTRQGGMTEVYGERQLNLALTKDDSAENVERNRERFVRKLRAQSAKGNPWPLAVLNQVHSAVIHRVFESQMKTQKRTGASAVAHAMPTAGDGLITNARGILLAVKVADCLPVIVADRRRKAVGIFHAGWRGTVQRIVEKGVGEMRRQLGCDPEDLVAAIGPSIGVCCYEIGEEVEDEFDSQFAYSKELFEDVFDSWSLKIKYPMLFLNQRAPGHGEPALSRHLDLVKANRRQLLDAGVAEANIESLDLCTACRTDLFFSYRKEHVTGRMLAVVGIR